MCFFSITWRGNSEDRREYQLQYSQREHTGQRQDFGRSLRANILVYARAAVNHFTIITCFKAMESNGFSLLIRAWLRS